MSTGMWRAALLTTLLCGCGGPHDLKSIELNDHTDHDLDGEISINRDRDIDILFVIDDSNSMVAEQANLAANFPVLIEMLEHADVRANYRIGLTTTNNGHPLCSGDTTPEGGNLVLSSCKDRLDDFVIEGADVRDVACNDMCTLDADELEILPTRTDYDSEPKPRPWLERIDGVSNLPAGTDMAAAFSCFAPQGVGGCGYEAQLESMYLALARAEASSETSYGFLRRGARLAIVIITDEVDCSYDKDWAEIFSPEGNRVFWSDPEAEWPTSAVCWNAGVQCWGSPVHYEECEPVDLDVDGQPAGPGEAVLHPVARYRDRLQAIEDDKWNYRPGFELPLTLIGGVAPDGSVLYAEAGDPEFQLEYGIGPGCKGPLGEAALPPVRIRSLVEEFSPGNMHSICAPDFTAAFESIVDEIHDGASCFIRCLGDSDPSTEFVEPNCRVEQRRGHDQPPADVPECLRTAEGGYAFDPISDSLLMPSDDVDVCFGLLADADMLTPDLRDDVPSSCLEYGRNVAFELAFRPGVPEPRGPFFFDCIESSDPEVDCP